VSELASEHTDYSTVEEEPTLLAAKNVITGGHLWSSATAFFFVGFVFAYFYLRSLDAGGMWRPKHVDPSLALGTASMLTLVGAALVVRLGLGRLREAHRGVWQLEGALGLALCLCSLALQVAEWATQGFGPAQGGYASVYLAWTGMLAAFVLGATYWLETTYATAMRYGDVEEGGGPPPGHASGDRGRMGHDIADPLSLVRPQLTAVSFYLEFLSAIAVLTWVVLYLV
jgi:heme/copper-type cytochrome/quinol oxidase subunit 3